MSKRSGDRCKLAAAVGLTKCYMHAGLSRTQRMTAKAEFKLNRQLANVELGPVENPLKELAHIAAQVIWFKDQVAERVNELTEVRYSTEHGEQLRAEIALFERALDRCEKFLATMARLNIDQRLVAIEERQADLIASTVAAVIAELGMSAQAQNDAKVKIVRRLRAVQSA